MTMGTNNNTFDFRLKYYDLKTLDFVAIDFETATNKEPMPCQIGITVVSDGNIKESFSRYIQPPGNKYSNVCMAVHHITPEMTESEPTFPSVWTDIKHYFQKSFIVAHNAAFDISVLQRALNYYNIPLPDIMGYICTCDIFGREKLNIACHQYGIELNNHHNAQDDSLACAQLYLCYVYDKEKLYDTPFDGQGCLFFDEDFTESHARLNGDILVKDLSLAKNKNHPFYDKKIVITGVFRQDRKELANYLKSNGADINTSISKKTDFVLIGDEPGIRKIEKLDTLQMDGYHVRRIYQEDLDRIICGKWEGYEAIETTKRLNLTYEHYEMNHVNVIESLNPIYGKELFFGNSKDAAFSSFAQLTGNFGAFGDTYLSVDTNLCVLNDSTIQALKNGEKDETILYIEDYYNSTKAVKFEYKFISVDDILSFCKSRIDRTNDTISGELYDKYTNVSHK